MGLSAPKKIEPPAPMPPADCPPTVPMTPPISTPPVFSTQTVPSCALPSMLPQATSRPPPPSESSVRIGLVASPMSFSAKSQALPERTLAPPGLPFRMLPTGAAMKAVSPKFWTVTSKRDRSPKSSTIWALCTLVEVSVPGPDAAESISRSSSNFPMVPDRMFPKPAWSTMLWPITSGSGRTSPSFTETMDSKARRCTSPPVDSTRSACRMPPSRPSWFTSEMKMSPAASTCRSADSSMSRKSEASPTPPAANSSRMSVRTFQLSLPTPSRMSPLRAFRITRSSAFTLRSRRASSSPAQKPLDESSSTWISKAARAVRVAPGARLMVIASVRLPMLPGLALEHEVAAAHVHVSGDARPSVHDRVLALQAGGAAGLDLVQVHVDLGAEEDVAVRIGRDQARRGQVHVFAEHHADQQRGLVHVVGFDLVRAGKVGVEGHVAGLGGGQGQTLVQAESAGDDVGDA